MADAVQMLLEEMVPELQGFVEHGVLSKAEVRALVKKRTDFEYRLRRRAAERRDFERYIEYERTFEQLLKARRARLGAEKGKAAAKFSCVKHIHFIFDRAVKKFRGDIALWLEWIDYAKSEQSSKVLSKIFARALQLHPRNAQLWVHAAAYEWDSGNVTASRTLLQRGIRLNNKSADLWREYFRMEVLFTARLAERRRVLGLGKGAKAPAAEVAGGGAAISIGELDEEGKGVSDGVALPDTPSADAGLEELLAGSIPRAVVRYARETMGSNPELFFAMYDLCYLGGDSARRQLEDEILAIIDDIAASPPPPASSVASSESAAAGVENATAAAVTGCATRRAARAMAESAAAGSEGAAVCDAAQDVLDKYLSPYCSAAGAPLSPKTSPRKSAKGSKGQKLADRSAGASAGDAPAASVPDIPGDGSTKGNKVLAAAMWQAACGFWAEVEKQAKGKGSAASAGRNHELAKEAGARASQMLAAARQQGMWTEVIALESIKRTLKAGRAGTAGDAAGAKAGGGKGKGKRLANSAQGSEKDAGAEALGIAKQALEHLPGSVNVAAEYLRLASTVMMVRAGGEGETGEEEALTSLAATVDQVLKTCGKAPGAHKLWTDRVRLQVPHPRHALGPRVVCMCCVADRHAEPCTPFHGVYVRAYVV
jgi:hypothetical protein